VKQLEDGYARFVALSFFFLCAKFYPFRCRHVKVPANDKVGRFLGHGVDADAATLMLAERHSRI